MRICGTIKESETFMGTKMMTFNCVFCWKQAAIYRGSLGMHHATRKKYPNCQSITAGLCIYHYCEAVDDIGYYDEARHGALIPMSSDDACNSNTVKNNKCEHLFGSRCSDLIEMVLEVEACHRDGRLSHLEIIQKCLDVIGQILDVALLSECLHKNKYCSKEAAQFSKKDNFVNKLQVLHAISNIDISECVEGARIADKASEALKTTDRHRLGEKWESRLILEMRLFERTFTESFNKMGIAEEMRAFG